jgi:hypothetical protein
MLGSVALLALAHLLVGVWIARVGARRVLPPVEAAPAAAQPMIGAVLVVVLGPVGPLQAGTAMGQGLAILRDLLPGARIAQGLESFEVQLDEQEPGRVHALAWRAFYALEANNLPVRVGVAVRHPGESPAQCAVRAAMRTQPDPTREAAAVRGAEAPIHLVA